MIEDRIVQWPDRDEKLKKRALAEKDFYSLFKTVKAMPIDCVNIVHSDCHNCDKQYFRNGFRDNKLKKER